MMHFGSSDPILLCDFGGTHGRLGLFHEHKIQHLKKYELDKFKTHIDLFRAYRSDIDLDFKHIAIAAAGAHTSNVFQSGFQENSKITESYFAEHDLNLHVLLNDFEASAWGVLSDQNKEIILRKGDAVHDAEMSCLIGPGTGLGCAYIQQKGNMINVIGTHGGHMRPSPATHEQHVILQALQETKSEAVIYEDIASGRGLKLLYRLITGHELESIYQILETPTAPHHTRILSLFHEFLGLYIQNVVVTAKAYKTIYLTGGLLDIIYQAGLFDFDKMETMINQKYVSTIEAALKSTPIIYIDDTYLALHGLKKYLEYHDA